MTAKPTIFIASASEDLPLANAAFSELEDVCDPTVWDQDIFTPSAYVLEDFERLVHQFDYALLVLGATDQRISRGKSVQVPRDNVIAELGLFVGAIGRSRVFVLTSDAHGLDLPTDLLGFGVLKYHHRADENLRAAVRTACTRIKSVVTGHLRKAQSLEGVETLWPLRLLVMSGDRARLDRIESELERYGEIVETVQRKTVDVARGELTGGKVDGAFIDPWSCDVRDSVDLIGYIRDRRREIGISLLGSFRELYEFPGIGGIWRQTFQHYWRLPIDASDEAFAVSVEDNVLLLSLYRLSNGAFGELPGAFTLSIMRPEVAGSWEVWRRYA